MKAWNEIQGDFEQDKRDSKPGEYSVVAVGGVGRVACYHKGMVITDFYTNCELITMMSGSARMNSEVTGKSERDRQMEEIPPATVNPSSKPLETKPLCGDTHKEERNVKS